VPSTTGRPPGWTCSRAPPPSPSWPSAWSGWPLALLGELRPRPTAVGALLVFLGLHLLWWSRQRATPRTGAGPVRARAGRPGPAGRRQQRRGQRSQHYEHLIVDGDPAVYAVTGALLARNGELTVPTRAEELYGGNETVEFAGSGWFDTRASRPSTRSSSTCCRCCWPPPAGSAAPSLLLLVNPVLGGCSLLAFYAFAARVVRPAWALLATASLAVLLPQLHFSRDAFSEIPSQLLVFAGLALLWDVTGPRRPTGWPALAGGSSPGWCSAARRWPASTPSSTSCRWPSAAARPRRLDRPGRRRRRRRLGRLALVDGYLGSPVYVESVEGPLLQTAAALLLVAVAAVVVRRSPAWVPRLGARLAWPVAGLTVGWRPSPGSSGRWCRSPARSRTARTRPSPRCRRRGAAVDVPRSYDELTMVWLSWYLGPAALALGVLGLAWLSWRVLRGQDLRLAPFVLLVGLATAVYVWHPGIFPVQYWASRRFLPVTFPGCCSRRCGPAPVVGPLAGLAADAARAGRRVRAGLPAGAAARRHAAAQLRGAGRCGRADVRLAAAVRRRAAGRRGAVTDGLLQPVQGYCGVAAGAASLDTTPADIEEVAAAARAAGRRLVLLSPIPDPAVAPDAEFREIFDVTVPPRRCRCRSGPTRSTTTGSGCSSPSPEPVDSGRRRGLPDRTL
jgi:hypothetical protein